MGRGGDASLGHTGSGRLLKRSSSVMEKLHSLQSSFDAKKKMRDLHNDLTVLKNNWFKKLAKTDDHAERLEQFYGPQAHACTFDAVFYGDYTCFKVYWLEQMRDVGCDHDMRGVTGICLWEAATSPGKGLSCHSGCITFFIIL